MVDLRGLVGRRRWGADFVVATAAGVFLGLLGPFGTFSGTLWQRVAYWTAMAWGGFAVFAVSRRLVLARFGPRPRPAWAWLAGYAVMMSAPLGLVSWLMAAAIWPGAGRHGGLTPGVWYLESLTITAGYVALFAMLRSRQGRPARTTLPSSPPGLLGVSPSEVLCLQMEDHYVRVHTAGGSRLVLATLAQGIGALGRSAGLRVHRSWWVAEKAVAGAVSEGRNLRLILTNGLSAPVARSSVPAVREAGWLDRRSGPANPDGVLAGGELFG